MSEFETTLHNSSPGVPGDIHAASPPKQKGRVKRGCTYCLGALLLGIAIIAIIGATMYFVSKPDREESTKFIDEKVVPALKVMEPESFEPIGTKVLINELNTTEGLRVLKAFKERLGPIQSIDNSKSNWGVRYDLSGTTIRFTAPAEFQKSTGTIELRLRQHDDIWKLNSVNIRSEALIP